MVMVRALSRGWCNIGRRVEGDRVIPARGRVEPGMEFEWPGPGDVPKWCEVVSGDAGSERKRPGPKPGSKRKARASDTTVGSSNPMRKMAEEDAPPALGSASGSDQLPV